jgi:hypothetical protein
LFQVGYAITQAARIPTGEQDVTRPHLVYAVCLYNNLRRFTLEDLHEAVQQRHATATRATGVQQPGIAVLALVRHRDTISQEFVSLIPATSLFHKHSRNTVAWGTASQQDSKLLCRKNAATQLH